MTSTPHAAFDSESAQLKTWLRALERRYGSLSHPQLVNHPQVKQVQERLKAIDEAKKADKRQAKRAKKLWREVLKVADEHAPTAGQALRKLQKSPSDAAALGVVGSTIAGAAIKNPELKSVASQVLPMLSQLFVDDEDDDEKDEE